MLKNCIDVHVTGTKDLLKEKKKTRAIKVHSNIKRQWKGVTVKLHTELQRTFYLKNKNETPGNNVQIIFKATENVTLKTCHRT